MSQHSRLVSCLLPSLLLLLLTTCAFSIATIFTPEDLSAISLYGSSAVYKPALCPKTVSFIARARPLPELPDNRIGLFPSDIKLDGWKCNADTAMIDFTSIGMPDHFPPQWVFEDSNQDGHPVNFTCGPRKYSIRFGYFNDVSTRGTNGMLRRDVVYLDFAVIPNSHPFSFCSYSTRRKDGLTPLDFHPFPKRKVWRRVQRIAQGKFVKTKGGVEAGDGEVLEEQVKDKIVATVGPKSERFLDLHDPFSS